MFYKQCVMQKENKQTTGWIEARGAIVGASVELKEDGSFWNVVSVGDYQLDDEAMRETKDRARGNNFGSVSVSNPK